MDDPRVKLRGQSCMVRANSNSQHRFTCLTKSVLCFVQVATEFLKRHTVYGAYAGKLHLMESVEKHSLEMEYYDPWRRMQADRFAFPAMVRRPMFAT